MEETTYIQEDIAYKDTDSHSAQLEMLSRKGAPSNLSLYRYLNIHMYIYIYTYTRTYMNDVR